MPEQMLLTMQCSSEIRLQLLVKFTAISLTYCFLNFESRFSAQVCKFNAHSDQSKLPEALTAFILIASSNVDNSQLISILAASAPHAESFTGTPTTTSFLKKVSYESIASVIRQYEKKS